MRLIDAELIPWMDITRNRGLEYMALKSEIDAIPPVLEYNWIPVTKSVPEIDKWNNYRSHENYLVCDVHGNIYVAFAWQNWGGGIDWVSPYCYGCNKRTLHNIVAWMPLPKPYECEVEDDVPESEEN